MATTYFARTAKHNPTIDSLANVGDSAFIDCQGQVTIGAHVFFGHEVMILTALHDYMLFGSARMSSRSVRPVNIEEGAWICSRAIICPGVTVGAHAVVAAGAVVMRNVAPYTLVAGNPARMIRRLKSAT
jgi:acetyltransferase-like isoleucine patch superfamily enzyme